MDGRCPLRLHLLLFALMGCPAGKGDDADGDGVIASVDCDDADPTVFPGAADGCDEVDNDCDGAVDEDAIGGQTWFLDDDGDGYGGADSWAQACDAPEDHVDNADDCDDTNADVHPGAEETCDGLDNDCDQQLDADDEDLVWFRDQDGDGYGTTDQVSVGCEPPEGYVGNADDCDDADPAINPEALESCDEVDEDCDGVVDDAAGDGQTAYWDQDGDGYGDPASSWTGCEVPAGYVTAEADLDATDCDDSNADVHPGADESCDALDNDCDGEVDEEAIDGATWLADDDDDGYGDPDSATTACEAPEGYVSPDGEPDCDDGDASTNPGAAEICDDGVDNDCDDSAGACGVTGTLGASDADLVVQGAAANDYLGRSAALGDIDADGSIDMVLGGNGVDTAEASTGAAYVLYGPFTTGCSLSSDYDARLAASVTYGYAGTSVGLPDVDGDGAVDLLVGEPGTATSRGTVALYLGGAGAISGDLDDGDADATWTGQASYDMLGGSVASAGDMDGDGADDLVVGAYGYDDGGTTTGAAWLIYGGTAPSGSTDIGSGADASWVGSGAGSDTYAGWVVSAAGDLDGDGLSELLIGAKWDDTSGYDAGAIYLVYGDSTRSAGSMSTSDADGWALGGDDSDHLGATASSAGDADGDGYDDFLTAAPDADGSAGNALGEAWLILGGASRLSGALSATTVWTGAKPYDYLGDGVGSAGDLDGDGQDDVVIGGYGEDTAASSAGAAWLFLGPVSAGALTPSDADATLTGATGGDGYFGRTFAGPGDLDGDGQIDLAIGAWYDDGAASGAGAVYVFLGGGM